MNSSYPSAMALAVILLFVLPDKPSRAQEGKSSPELQVKLGKRLFEEKRFSNPGANFLASCAICHKTSDSTGSRGFADSEPLTLIPAQRRGEKPTTARNTPTLYDVAENDRFFFDGRADSLVEATREELLGRHMGWGPRDADRVGSEILMVYQTDMGQDAGIDAPYSEEFKAAYGVDVDLVGEAEAVDLTVRAIAQYVETIKTTPTSPWDAFASMNRLPGEPARGSSPEDYAGAVLGRLANQQNRGLVKLVKGFDAEAYAGLKIFMRTDLGEPGVAVGNCVACHIPPRFTDGLFHATGVARAEYDALHGEGALARLELPAGRPSEELSSRPRADDRSRADLGRWNYAADGGGSAETGSGGAIAAFKTPTLRNLQTSDPYMHNGAYPTIEAAVEGTIEAGRLARADDAAIARVIDPAFRSTRLGADDVAPLAAFLRALGEVGWSEYRELQLSAHALEFDAE